MTEASHRSEQRCYWSKCGNSCDIFKRNSLFLSIKNGYYYAYAINKYFERPIPHGGTLNTKITYVTIPRPLICHETCFCDKHGQKITRAANDMKKSAFENGILTVEFVIDQLQSTRIDQMHENLMKCVPSYDDFPNGSFSFNQWQCAWDCPYL